MNIKHREYVYYMHFIHKIGCKDMPLTNIKRRESEPGQGIMKLKRHERFTVVIIEHYGDYSDQTSKGMSALKHRFSCHRKCINVPMILLV